MSWYDTVTPVGAKNGMIERVIMRTVFCAVPAICAGTVVALFSPAIGAIVFVCAFGLGLDVTRVRPERGEF